MGLIRGEGIILREKYMKNYGLTFREATDKVSQFIDEIDNIKSQMKAKKRSEEEIKNKIQDRFVLEFEKLKDY